MIRTPDRIRDEIRKARAAGESLKKLAKRFGLTVQTVCNIARDGRKIPLEQRRAKDGMIVEMLLSGRTYAEIQEVTGLPYDKVYRVAKAKRCLRIVGEWNSRKYLKVGHKIWEMGQAGLRPVYGREFDAVYDHFSAMDYLKSLRARSSTAEAER